MQIIKNRQVVDDEWQMIGVNDTLPEAHFIIPFARWKNEREMFIDKNTKLGVCVNGDDNLKELIDDLGVFSIIALEFPKYTDGRCFSYARLLRERHHYQGELRAVGNVLRDQLALLERCGINSFVLDVSEDLSEALKSFDDISVKYQSAADAVEPLYRYR